MGSILNRSSAGLALFLALAAGCVAPERKPAVTAVASLSDMRSELIGGRADIDSVLTSVSELQAKPTSLTAPYDHYRSAVAAVSRRAEAVSTRVQDMRTRSADYRANWSQENAQITDPTVRASAEERRQRVTARYDEIDHKAQELRAAYDPFITKLHDLQTVLANDLTYPGVDAAKPAFDEVRTSASSLRAKVDELVALLDESKGRLAPSTKPVD